MIGRTDHRDVGLSMDVARSVAGKAAALEKDRDGLSRNHRGAACFSIAYRPEVSGCRFARDIIRGLDTARSILDSSVRSKEIGSLRRRICRTVVSSFSLCGGRSEDRAWCSLGQRGRNGVEDNIIDIARSLARPDR
jgi:hypothetical protein